MNEGSANIPFIIAVVAAAASLIGVIVLLVRLRAQGKRHREAAQRSAETVAKLKTQVANLRFAIRKKIIDAKSDRDLASYFTGLLERADDGS